MSPMSGSTVALAEGGSGMASRVQSAFAGVLRFRRLNGRWYRDLLAAALAVLLAGGISGLSPLVANASGTCCYAWVTLPSGVNGIDGYVGGAVIGGSGVPTTHHVAEWLGVEYGTQYGNTWVQTGEYQGAIVTISSQYAVDTYIEWQPCGDSGVGYGIFDNGAPPSPTLNYAFYVRGDGYTRVQICPVNQGGQTTENEFVVSMGSMNNPIGWGYMPSSWGYPSSNLEDATGSDPLDPMRTTCFGLNNSCQQQSGYQMSLYIYSTNSWKTWTDSRTQHGFSSGMTQVLVRNYYAFYAN